MPVMGLKSVQMETNSNKIRKLSTLYVLSVCLCGVQSYCVSSYDKLAQEAIFVNLTDEARYKKWMRPHIDTQIMVNTSMEVYSMASINERDSAFSLNLLIDLLWNDHRLAHDMNSQCEEVKDLSIEGSEWHLDRIWSPKLRVPNNKNPSAMDRDAKIILLRVSAKGDVRVRKRLILDLDCQMDFRYYPFDEQICMVEFISSDLSEEHLALEWTVSPEKPFVSNNNAYITGYELLKIDPTHHLKSGNTTSKGETFSKVSVECHLKREWTHFMLDIYLPSFLVVIVSWISFWMDITATPARITLGVTTMLTFVTVSKDSREDLPNISYVNALDIWFVVCTGFIFFGLIEFIIITYISRAEKRKIRQMKTLRRNLSHSQLSLSSTETQTTFTTNDGAFLSPPKTPNQTRFPFEGIEIKVPKSPFDRQTSVPMSPALKKLTLALTPPDSPNPDIEQRTGAQIDLKLTPVEIAEAIDRKCRYVFPLVFIFFNIIYWSFIALK